ncbi:uncharacterized protein LOC128987013 [Macrosteles quadrilineatus]|uniref:uncharacterized protein LOC128987013 n=1 Tax=Macrosteles quadrilineatus TaxID=74068 RepID=UPI0023E3447B|nr:uncharacterized protein LOC128987013 [Macrosteles quadrilineatus]
MSGVNSIITHLSQIQEWLKVHVSIGLLTFLYILGLVVFSISCTIAVYAIFFLVSRLLCMRDNEIAKHDQLIINRNVAPKPSQSRSRFSGFPLQRPDISLRQSLEMFEVKGK